MDAHQIFWDYQILHQIPTNKTKDMDRQTLRLVDLIVGETKSPPPTAPNSPINKTKPTSSVATTAPNSRETNESPISSTATIDANPRETKESDKVTDVGLTSLNTITDYQTNCDSLFVNTRWQLEQLNNIAKYTKSVVCMTWVKAVASQVRGATGSGFMALHDSDRHVHVVGNVSKCLELLLNEPAHRIEEVGDHVEVTPSKVVTTFSWTINSPSAIHIQDLQLAMRKVTKCKKFLMRKLTTVQLIAEWNKPVQRDDDTPILLLMEACSIGLPTKKMFKSSEFLQRWENYRFKEVCEKNIIITILRDKFGTLEQIGVEATQLLEQYSSNKELFSTKVVVDQYYPYFFNQWYSYPSPTEMPNLLHRVTVLKNKLFSPVSNSI